MSDFIRLPELAERLDVHPGTIRRWRRAGLMPPCFRVGRRGDLLFKKTDIDKWLEQWRQPAQK